MDIKKIFTILNTDLTKSIYGKIFFGVIAALFALDYFGAFKMLTPKGRCELKFERYISQYNKTAQVMMENSIKDGYIEICLKGNEKVAEELIKEVQKQK